MDYKNRPDLVCEEMSQKAVSLPSLLADLDMIFVPDSPTPIAIMLLWWAGERGEEDVRRLQWERVPLPLCYAYGRRQYLLQLNLLSVCVFYINRLQLFLVYSSLSNKISRVVSERIWKRHNRWNGQMRASATTWWIAVQATWEMGSLTRLVAWSRSADCSQTPVRSKIS